MRIKIDGWEQRKLGDLTKELSDYATMASGLPLLTSSRSGLMYQSDFRDRKTTTSDETLFSIVPKGSCTYRHMSDDDIFHLNINVLEKGLVSREYPVFISSEDNDLEFIIQHINSSDRFRGFCKGQKKGGTRTRLYYNVAVLEAEHIHKCLVEWDDLFFFVLLLVNAFGNRTEDRSEWKDAFQQL